MTLRRSSFEETDMKAYTVLLVTALCCVGIAAGANSRPITGSLNFVYDPNSTIRKCYLVELSRDEMEHVKSRTGIQDIELKMMREWMGVLKETMVFHTDPHLPPYFQTHCKGQDIFYMARTLPTGSSFPSVIG